MALGLRCGVRCALPVRAAADIASDHPAAILVFPKLIVDTTNGLDTMVRISNVSETRDQRVLLLRQRDPGMPAGPAGRDLLLPQQATVFRRVRRGDRHRRVSSRSGRRPTSSSDSPSEQPTGWLVSRGERTENCDRLDGVCSNDGTTLCDEDTPCLAPAAAAFGRPASRSTACDGRIGPAIGSDQRRRHSALARGSVHRRAQVHRRRRRTASPVARNDLIGEVLIGRVQAGPDESIDVAGYNAIGIPALVNVCQPNGRVQPERDARARPTCSASRPTTATTTLVLAGRRRRRSTKAVPTS